MISEVISIGDELLIGQVTNSNASWLGEQLFDLGIPLRYVATVGDEHATIIDAIDRALHRSDVVIVTGGLGPTHDDITRAAVVDYLHTDLVEDPIVLEHVAAIFRRRGIELSPSNRSQALVPRGSTVLPNALGTAPGLRFDRNGKILCVLPGVPQEMKRIFTDAIRPSLAGKSGRGRVARTLNTTGIAESLLFELIGPVPDVESGAGKLAFLPNLRGTRMRITVEARDQADAERIALRMEKFIRERAGRYIFGVGETTLEEAVGLILREQKKTIATAESCTGGFMAHLITNVAGSSDYFLRGYVTYVNSAKVELLGVPAALIEAHGAVSAEVAEAMARGARERSGADVSVSTTGIAGPTGGTAEKPVGLVWIGISDAAGTTSHRMTFSRDRIANKERFTAMALELVRRRLLGVQS